MSRAGHQPDDLVAAPFAPRVAFDSAPVAQDGAGVRQRVHLVQPVGHVDDRDAVGLERVDHREQPLHLARLQRRGRLVEDHHPRFAAERAGDHHQLAFRVSQPVDPRAGVDVDPESSEQRRRVPRHRRPVDDREAEETPRRDGLDQHVLRDAQCRDDAHLLRDDDDAARQRVPRAREPAGPAVDRDRAAVGAVDAAQDLDQRRLAGAVLADQRMDLTGPDRERHVVQREGRLEALVETPRLDRRPGQCAAIHSNAGPTQGPSSSPAA